MRRTLCIAMTLCMLVGQGFAVLANASTDDSGIPDFITITHPDGLEPMTTWVEPVKYPHGFHAAKIDCLVCHHEEASVEDGGVPAEYAPCTDCHADEGIEEPTSFYAAWHAKSEASCVGCHYQLHLKGELESRDKAPISCTKGCHTKAHGGE